MSKALKQSLATTIINKKSDYDLFNWAIQAILDGFDSLSLHILAGFSEHDSDIKTYFSRTCSELNIGFQNELDAAKYLIECCLNDTIQGSMQPKDACQKITEDIFYPLRDSMFLNEKNWEVKFGINQFIVNYYDYDQWVDKNDQIIPFDELLRQLDAETLDVAREWILRNCEI